MNVLACPEITYNLIVAEILFGTIKNKVGMKIKKTM